jgi:membrane protease subunit HflC
MRRLLTVVLIILGVCVAFTVLGRHDWGPVVITREGEQKIVLFLDEPRRTLTPGPNLRIPLLESVESYSSRWLHADTEELRVDTTDGEQLNVDSYVIWRIQDPVEFFRAYRGNQRNAEERIDRIVRDRVRKVIGRHTLFDVLKDRRQEITQDITEECRSELAQGGIEVRDVRINRTDLPEGTEGSVYSRMRTERERLAKKSRAEGDERARTIRAEADREARVIVANARRDAEITRGQGDAEAARIYAEAYGAEPEFYAFMRSLEAYRTTIDENTTLIISPDSEFFKYLDGGTK